MFSSCVGIGLVMLVTGCSHYTDQLQDEFALQQVGDMIVIHIGKNGEVPASWDDMRSEYERTQMGYNNFSFEELQDRVHVAFSELQKYASSGEASRFIKAVKSSDRLVELEVQISQRVVDALRQSPGDALE